jgi:hypothetical protein
MDYLALDYYNCAHLSLEMFLKALEIILVEAWNEHSLSEFHPAPNAFISTKQLGHIIRHFPMIFTHLSNCELMVILPAPLNMRRRRPNIFVLESP